MKSRRLALLALLVAAACSHAQRPSISVVAPQSHSLLAVDARSGVLPLLVLELCVLHFAVPSDGVVRVTGNMIGDSKNGFVHSSPSPFITITGPVGPGSYFWKLELVHRNGSAVGGVSPARLHWELVVPQDIPLPQLRHTLSVSERRPTVLFNLPHPHHTSKKVPQQKRVCFVGETSGQFDGQRKIWVQVMAALRRPQWEIGVVAFEHPVLSSPFLDELRRLNVSTKYVPLEVERADLSAHHLEPAQAMPTILRAFDHAFTAHPSGKSMEAFHQRVSTLRPPFAAAIWQRVVTSLHESCHGAVLAIGSSRNVADKLIVTAARVASVRAVVVELTNLHPQADEMDVLIAPSHFALHHPSVAETTQARQRHVLHAGVDTRIFRPAKVHDEYATSKLFTVGVVIVGDGSLRRDLERLIHEWGLDAFVQFTGGIYSEMALADQLRQFDVFVSPCFHETFGIAPLEAMSCGVPVVGFASGGVSEYLEHRVNGLAVHEPSVPAMVGAVMTLREDESLRRRLGTNARRTVLQRFSLTTSVQQYVTLYERLAQRDCNGDLC